MIEETTNGPTSTDGAGVGPGVRVPVSVSQSLFWAGSRLSPDSPLYNMAFRIDIDGALDPGIFRAAVDAVVAESDALRTVFTTEDGALTAQVLDASHHQHEDVDFSQSEDVERELEDWIDARIRQPFDLGQTTFDSVLLRRAEDRWTWLLNQHHISTDAGSAKLIYERVAKHYARMQAGEAAADAPLPRFADHVRAELSDIGSPQHVAARDHWQAKLDEAGPRPALYGKPAEHFGGASKRLWVAFGEERTQRLDDLAATDGVRLLGADLTRFSLLATAVVAYLTRISGERAITFGATTNNRRTPSDRQTIGLFVELFPLGAVLEEGATFRSLYDAMSVEASALLFHGRPGTSSPATARQFNVILNYLNMVFVPFNGMPVQVQWLDPGAVDPGHALRFNISDFTGRGDLELGLDMNTDGFDKDGFDDCLDVGLADGGAHGLADGLAKGLMDRMPEHFLRVLDAMLDDFDAPIDAVPIAGTADASLIENSAPVPDSLAGVPTVVSLLDEQVEANPDAIALQQGDLTLSYGALHQRSVALARELHEHGIGAGDIVGICARRSVELVIAVFGVLRAGAAFAPLEPRLPAQRLQLILEDTGARVVLADEAGQAAVAGRFPGEVLRIPGPSAASETLPLTGDPGAAATLPAVDPTAAAYVYYTSGSTGRPKGVVVGHAGLGDYTLWSLRDLCPDGPVSFPLFSAFGFDLTVDSLFVPFAAGGRLVIYPEPMTGTDLSVREVFADDAVDVVKLTPSHLALVVDSARRTERIRTLLFSGEELKTDLAARGLETLGDHVAIINEYGPTEAIVGCTYHRFDPARDRGPAVPIGVPGEGASIYLLDEGLNPVPRHVEGEVYIGGDRLAHGYLGRPNLTAERFLDDPFRPGGRMYRTGDHAHWDGELLHYTGRRDGQIKIRGNRIEIGEIEHAITACPGVGRSVVSLARVGGGSSATSGAGPEGGALRLVAYYTSDGTVAPEAIRERLAQVLTEAMIPSFFVELDEIPITPNGKIDRAALPGPSEGWSEQAPEFRPPESATEVTLAELWADVLGLEAVGLDDNFFQLGGDSIDVIRVVDRARGHGLGVEVPDVFEQQTLAALARCADDRTTADTETQASAAPPPERFSLAGLDQAGLDQVARLLGDKPDTDEGS